MVGCSSSVAASCTGSSHSGASGSPWQRATYPTYPDLTLTFYLWFAFCDLNIFAQSTSLRSCIWCASTRFRRAMKSQCLLSSMFTEKMQIVMPVEDHQNVGVQPVPQGYSLPRYLAPSPPVTTVLLPTSFSSWWQPCWWCCQHCWWGWGKWR